MELGQVCTAALSRGQDPRACLIALDRTDIDEDRRLGHTHGTGEMGQRDFGIRRHECPSLGWDHGRDRRTAASRAIADCPLSQDLL